MRKTTEESGGCLHLRQVFLPIRARNHGLLLPRVPTHNKLIIIAHEIMVGCHMEHVIYYIIRVEAPITNHLLRDFVPTPTWRSTTRWCQWFPCKKIEIKRTAISRYFFQIINWSKHVTQCLESVVTARFETNSTFTKHSKVETFESGACNLHH